MPITRSEILGLPIDALTMADAVEWLELNLLSADVTKLVFTADSNAFISAQTDPAYADLFDKADLITPDSAGPVWALAKSGVSLPGRVSGVDLVEELCILAAKHEKAIYFVGSAPGVAVAAAENLSQKYPGFKVAGARDGYFKPTEDEDVARAIAITQPDILVVAMGMPRQEQFILKTASIINAKIGIGVGGSLDVHSGTVKRAPVIIQKLKIEWLWRFILNPKKIAKVKNLPVFYWRVSRQKQK
ncbi:MAG TPA: WecB/TagA/CpsF family glycosyltransferase [Fimbriimonas sp.]|nr:WecB/TagA/CpsF family glycosyltransferase [Fimbriimonas sp.]